ncbi:MAG: hypothetical protein HC875_35095 [Anaerolineales bacterium]|nr:hypothetical protein [Anaerolineales bacterium]
MTTDLFRLYTAAEARQTILKRSPIGEMKLTPTLAKGIERVFGEALSLETAVGRILADVRERATPPCSIGPRKLTASGCPRCR